MWRRTYLLLLLVRLWFALSPSYLHPDENFQGPEVIAGKKLFPQSCLSACRRQLRDQPILNGPFPNITQNTKHADHKLYYQARSSNTPFD